MNRLINNDIGVIDYGALVTFLGAVFGFVVSVVLVVG